MNLIFFFIPFLLILPLVYAESSIISAREDLTEPDKPRYFAKIENNTITNVIVADPDFIINHMEGEWIETWMEQDNPRKRYAGIGYTYDTTGDGFVPPKKFASWVFNSTDSIWQASTPKPGDDYFWDDKVPDWARKK